MGLFLRRLRAARNEKSEAAFSRSLMQKSGTLKLQDMQLSEWQPITSVTDVFTEWTECSAVIVWRSNKQKWSEQA